MQQKLKNILVVFWSMEQDIMMQFFIKKKKLMTSNKVITCKEF